VKSRLYEEVDCRAIDPERTVLQLVGSSQGTVLVNPTDSVYYYEKGKGVKPASWFTERLPLIKDALKDDGVPGAGELFQKYKGEAEAMVRYGVEALENLSKTCKVPFAVSEHFLYDVCPTLAQPFIDNVSWK
jgi:hypothetical protein